MKSPKSLRVYLSGGMEFAKGEGADWRRVMEEWVQNNLGHSVFNPNKESDEFLALKCPDGQFRDLKHQDIDRYIDVIRDLVDIDCREIADRSDYVVCHWDESAQRGAGTTGELTMSRWVGKPVYMVTQMKLKDIPGWVLGCSTRVFGSFDELRRFLKQEYGAKQG